MEICVIPIILLLEVGDEEEGRKRWEEKIVEELSHIENLKGGPTHSVINACLLKFLTLSHIELSVRKGGLAFYKRHIFNSFSSPNDLLESDQATNASALRKSLGPRLAGLC